MTNQSDNLTMCERIVNKQLMRNLQRRVRLLAEAIIFELDEAERGGMDYDGVNAMEQASKAMRDNLAFLRCRVNYECAEQNRRQ